MIPKQTIVDHNAELLQQKVDVRVRLRLATVSDQHEQTSTRHHMVPKKIELQMADGCTVLMWGGGAYSVKYSTYSVQCIQYIFCTSVTRAREVRRKLLVALGPVGNSLITARFQFFIIFLIFSFISARKALPHMSSKQNVLGLCISNSRLEIAFFGIFFWEILHLGKVFTRDGANVNLFG